jgi:hypothetical protein
LPGKSAGRSYQRSSQTAAERAMAAPGAPRRVPLRTTNCVYVRPIVEHPMWQTRRSKK